MKSPVALSSLLIAALATAAAGIVYPARAQEYPMFDCYGFAATPHQLQVIESNHVEEQSTPSALVLDGMPASPHQLAVLRRRSDTQ